MLYLNSLNISIKSQLVIEKTAAINLVNKIVADYNEHDMDTLLSDDYRSGIFNFYMDHNEEVFRSSSKAMIFDYRNYLENEYGDFLKSPDGEYYLALLQAVDLIWQEVQAPVSELVAAGKSQLIEYNGEATYENFAKNTANKPELFKPTKKLVDHYLNTGIMNFLIEYHLRGQLDLSNCNLCLQRLKNELQDFAVMARQLGFWIPPKKSNNILLKDIATLEMLAFC